MPSTDCLVSCASSRRGTRRRPIAATLIPAAMLCLLGAPVLPLLQPPLAHAQQKKGDAKVHTFLELLEIAFAAFHRGDYPAAEKGFKEAEKRASSAPEELGRLDKLYYLMALSQIYQNNYAEAAKTIEIHRQRFPSSVDAEEMALWLGICFFQAKDWDNAYKAFGEFVTKFPEARQVDQARLYGALCHFQQEKLTETAEFLKPLIGKMRADIDNQAFLLRLLCLIRSNQLDEALAFAKDFDSSADRVYKIASFHLMVLELGSKFQETPEDAGEDVVKERNAKALTAYQLAWPQERVLARQEQRLAQLRELVARIPENVQGPTLIQRNLYKQLVDEVDKEITSFKDFEDYDTNLTLQQARCFMGMERFREGGLLLQSAVDRMPDSDLLAQVYNQLLYCLTRMESWGGVIRTADAFIQRFPQHELVPTAMYSKAESYMHVYDFASATKFYKELVEKYPQDPRAATAHFLAGYCLLSLDQNKDGIAWLDEHAAKFQDSNLLEQVAYWRSMGFLYDKEYAKSREAHEAYVAKYPNGQFVEDSTYRHAYTWFGEKNYEKAIEELKAFQSKYAESQLRGEANNLLGDCYLATGEVERGITTFQATPAGDDRLHDYAQFRIFKALKSTERFDELEAKLNAFVAENPKSPRIAEAMQELAQYYQRQKNDFEKARQIYWDALDKYGPDPEAHAVEDLMLSLAKMYKTEEERKEFNDRLIKKSIAARENKQLTVVARVEWLNAQMNVRNDPAAAIKNLDEIARAVPPREQPAIILVDVADHLRRMGRTDKAVEFYNTLLSWWPRALYKDRVYAGLGLIALQKKEYEKALELFAQYEKEALSTQMNTTVMPAQADALLALNRTEDALKVLETMLEDKASRGLPAATALAKIGDIHFDRGDFKKSIPYYQRIYILYGSYPQPVSNAYLKSAQAFEKLNMEKEAQATYAEFVERADLKDQPEYAIAKKSLKTPPSS